MIVPNLASRPFLNTRPVWIVAAAAATVTLVLAILNIRLYLVTNEALGEQLARRDALAEQQSALEAEVRVDIAALDQVRWRSLAQKVSVLNVILAEHAFSWLALLDDVGDVMPYAVRLIQIQPSIDKHGRHRLSIRGVARTREALLEFLDNMIADPRFSVPRITGEDTPEESAVAGYTFVFTVEYLPAASEAAS